tara:strand:- start:359 stop:697 length:339 start_codon:yes stop_codon:yes gene_type:complete
MSIASFADFLKIKIAVGTVLSAQEKNNLKKPSIILTIDFGEEIGIKKSSAHLKKNYKCSDLINKQIIAIINFLPKQIGDIKSEVLVLGLPDDSNEPVLVSPDKRIKNGKNLY